MRPDVILTWPRHCDYPLFRQQLARDRWRYGRVLIVFSEHHVGQDLSDWVVSHTGPDVEFLAPISRHGQDWRDAAVNTALAVSESEWVLFLEQDFLIDDVFRFWEFIEYLQERYEPDAIGWEQDGRLHPSFLLVDRVAVNRTSRYFGPNPVDHFYGFGQQLLQNGRVIRFHPQGHEARHLAGLSQNHTLIGAGEYVEGIYHPAEFEGYIRECLRLESVQLNPAWRSEVEKYLMHKDRS